MIAIINKDGSMTHAWLEGRALSRDLARMRFRLALGVARRLV